MQTGYQPFLQRQPLNTPTGIDQRLTTLEIKSSLADDLLEQLSQTIYSQQQQIDILRHELAALREQVPEEGTTTFRSLRDELPPHY